MTSSKLPANASLNRLIAAIQDGDDDVRGSAWQDAAPAGAPAIQPLAALFNHMNFEVVRSAQRAAQRIVWHAGRPGAESEAKAVEQELLELLRNGSALVRRKALGWLSEIGGDAAVAPMARLLTDPECREEARCALLRLPSAGVSLVLRDAMAKAPESFRFALADALRRRGEQVEGYPTQKLTPTRSTAVR